MSGALDAVEELAAKAGKTPWELLGRTIWVDRKGLDARVILKAQRVLECTEVEAQANAALTTVAVNNIQAAVEALEERGCLWAYPCEEYEAKPLGDAEGRPCRSCAVLAAIEREAKEAVA